MRLRRIALWLTGVIGVIAAVAAWHIGSLVVGIFHQEVGDYVAEVSIPNGADAFVEQMRRFAGDHGYAVRYERTGQGALWQDAVALEKGDLTFVAENFATNHDVFQISFFRPPSQRFDIDGIRQIVADIDGSVRPIDGAVIASGSIYGPRVGELLVGLRSDRQPAMFAVLQGLAERDGFVVVPPYGGIFYMFRNDLSVNANYDERAGQLQINFEATDAAIDPAMLKVILADFGGAATKVEGARLLPVASAAGAATAQDKP